MCAESDEMLAARKAAEDAISKLLEYVDTVHIFCTKQREGRGSGAAFFSIGEGNFFARYGHIKLWLKREDAIETNRRDEDDEDDG